MRSRGVDRRKKGILLGRRFRGGGGGFRWNRVEVRREETELGFGGERDDIGGERERGAVSRREHERLFWEIRVCWEIQKSEVREEKSSGRGLTKKEEVGRPFFWGSSLAREAEVRERCQARREKFEEEDGWATVGGSAWANGMPA